MTQNILATRPAQGHRTLTPARPLCSASHTLDRRCRHETRGACIPCSPAPCIPMVQSLGEAKCGRLGLAGTLHKTPIACAMQAFFRDLWVWTSVLPCVIHPPDIWGIFPPGSLALTV